MSAFDDFVALLKLDVDIYHNAKVCGNWQINEHQLGATCFHIVTQGRCMLSVPGIVETEFNRGDLVIFPREIEHTMWAIGESQGEQVHLPYQSNQSGTGLLCAEVKVMHLFQNQLLSALPAVLLIKNDGEHTWLSHITELIMDESKRSLSARTELLNRLSEMLFVFAMRDYIDTESPEQGVLAIYGDKRLSKAIKAFHANPEKKWDLEGLARQAGMSRTSFAKHFKQKSGWTVNQYIVWWRMQLAWEMLAAGDKISHVAYQVGYQSEAAFSKAFFKVFSRTPGDVRKLGG